MTIDSQLKWDKHIDGIVKKITSGFYAINKAKHVLNRKHLTALYYVVVYPYISYGIMLWGNTYNLYLNKVFVMQKKIIRVIMNSDYNAHSEPFFKVLEILHLSDVYTMNVVKYVFSYLKQKLPIPLMNMFTRIGNMTVYYTRQLKAHKLMMPRVRTSLVSRCIMELN